MSFVALLMVMFCTWSDARPDVPAIEESVHTKTGTVSCVASGSSGLSTCNNNYYVHTIVTCADKSRILLTAEDGTNWCHAVHP